MRLLDCAMHNVFSFPRLSVLSSVINKVPGKLSFLNQRYLRLVPSLGHSSSCTGVPPRMASFVWPLQCRSTRNWRSCWWRRVVFLVPFGLGRTGPLYESVIKIATWDFKTDGGVPSLGHKFRRMCVGSAVGSGLT